MRTLVILLVLVCLTMTCVAIGTYRQSARFQSELEIAKNDLSALREGPVESAASEPIPDQLPQRFTESSHPGEAETEDEQFGVDLEKQLERKDRLILQLRQQLEAQEAKAEQMRERFDPRKWAERTREGMEFLLARKPEEYARVVEERKAIQRRMAAGLNDRLDLLRSIKPQGLSPEYLENHKKLLKRLNQVSDRIAESNVDPASEGAWRSGRDIFREFGNIGRMMRMERDILMNDFAFDLGFSDEDATAFVEYMEYLNDMTSPREFFRSVRGRAW